MPKIPFSNPVSNCQNVLRWLCLYVLLCAPQLLLAATEYSLQQEISAIASGDGEPNGLFGLSVAVDGDLAVVANLASTTRAARVRSYRRNGANWNYLAGQDIVVRGDSDVRMAFNEGTLAIASYTSTTLTSSLRIYRRNVDDDGWDREFSASPNSGENFFGIATTESIAVFGEIQNNSRQGRIWILRRNSGTGSWGSPQILAAATPQNDARFGLSVAIVAGAVVVGAPREDVLTTTNVLVNDAGAAYVFELTGSVWNQVIRITQPNNQLATNENFGQTVAISGADPSTPDRMLIGVPSNNTTGALGRVWRYARAAGVWTRLASSIAPPGGALASDLFGCAMSMDGDWAAIGICGKDTAANDAGAVLLVNFANSFNTINSATQRTDPQAAAGDQMGSNMAIDRDGPTVIVGSVSVDLYGNTNQGVVLTGSGPVNPGSPAPMLARTMDLGQGLNNAYTSVVANDGDTVMIGARGESIGNQLGRGAVYVYQRSAGGRVVFESRIVAPDGLAGDGFGNSIALSGDTALIGAAGRSVAGTVGAGAVYAFRRSGGVWTLEAQLLAPTLTPNGQFGVSVDVSGSTALVGALANSSSFFERSAAGTWSNTQTIAHRGNAVQLRGDLAVLADYNGGASNLGKFTTFARTGGSWLQVSVVFGAVAEQYFGYGISLSGDLLAVSSSGLAKPVQLYRRSGMGWLPEASVQPLDITASTYCLAVAVRPARLAFGCFDNAAGSTRSGALYVFEKQANNWLQTQKITLPNPMQDDFVGADSLQFDARGALMIGVAQRDLDFKNQGAVYLFSELLRDGFE